MDGKQLRNSILQWAIQGKLVPQDPNDEPASVLLERIREEKARLGKEKKIKRDKNESIIYRGDDNSYYEKFTATGEVKCIDEEIPFALPTGWEWTRFGSLINMRMGKTPPRGDINHWNNGTTSWVSISDMSDYGIVKSTKEKVSEYAVRNAFGNVVVPAGTLLMSFKLTVGRTSILDIDALHNEAIISIKPYVDNDNTLRDYLFYVLPLIANSGESKDAIKGKTLNSTSLYNLLIPLPPLDEQHRIVCKIRQVLPFVEIYALSQVKQNALNDSIIPQLRKSILQEAIQGKLVEQNLDDEPASVLLERIKQEKERLIKEKKIKRDKQDSFIYRGDDNKYWEKRGKEIVCIDDEIPFNIPDSWTWCRIKDIFLINPKNNAQDDIDAAFIPMEKIDATYLSSFTYSTKKWGEIKKGFTHFADGDVAFAKITPCFQNRKSMILRDLPNGIGAGTTELKVLRSYGTTIINEYLLFFLESSYFVDEATFKGTANQQRIISGYLENKLFPLPPLQEQQRIVDAVLSTWQVL